MTRYNIPGSSAVLLGGESTNSPVTYANNVEVVMDSEFHCEEHQIPNLPMSLSGQAVFYSKFFGAIAICGGVDKISNSYTGKKEPIFLGDNQYLRLLLYPKWNYMSKGVLEKIACHFLVMKKIGRI